MSTRDLLIRDTTFGFIDNKVLSERVFNPRLINNEPDNQMLDVIRDELMRASSFMFSVAFITSQAIAMLKEDLIEFVRRGGTGTIITSTYLDFNTPMALRELLYLDGIDVYVHDNPSAGFHAKGYVFSHMGGLELSAIIGSSNFTESALLDNLEWNLRFSTSSDGDIAYQLESAIQRQRDKCTSLSWEWINAYEARRKPPRYVDRTQEAFLPHPSNDDRIEPNDMQRMALANLDELIEVGATKALIISATGTGKTILGALAARNADPKRILFIAHREQILAKSLEDFQRVLDQPADEFGLFVGANKQTDKRFLFASVQSLNSQNSYRDFDPSEFDYIIVDEVHRSASSSYRTLLDYFRPGFLLGLTATPERTDGKDIFELFDYNTAYEIRLQAALEQKMLAPFHYFGVTDLAYEREGQMVTADDTSDFQFLTSEARVDHIIATLEKYGFPEDVRGLMFCSRKDEATELSALLNGREVYGRPLRTAVLLGESSFEQRTETVERLNRGELDYILTVDIFNEGVDIPAINQIVMLRSTQSSIIFTQQLGRGLRKATNKDHLRVIDFIGNYQNNFLIPIALYGDNSRDRDKVLRPVLERRRIGGRSTVNFDEISRSRIYESLKAASIDSMRTLKDDVQQLVFRLNRVPKLLDFARFGLTDPTVLATRRTVNYWELLFKGKFATQGPSPRESEFLKFLSRELLPGKQPQELVLLQLLLTKGVVTREEFLDVLADKAVAHDDADISVMERVLNLSFYEKRAYKLPGIVETDGLVYSLNEEFAELYHSSSSAWPASFKDHVDDLIDTALFTSRENGFMHGELILHNRYSRKDVSRMLRLETNQMGTLNGYKVDKYSGTIPIFVNYHKSSDLDSSIAYEDHFIDTRTMTWFTRSRRTLASGEVQSILSGNFPIHLFVRRDDTSGDAFFYLGRVTPRDAEQEVMQGNNGEPLDVVRMKLDLENPITEDFLHYLGTPATVEG